MTRRPLDRQRRQKDPKDIVKRFDILVLTQNLPASEKHVSDTSRQYRMKSPSRQTTLTKFELSKAESHCKEKK